MAIGVAWLAVLFSLTAALYASVGFGGGSTYIALLALADLDYRTLPIIALICNIIVVVGGVLRFQSRGLITWRKIWPILALSVPAAWIGGRFEIPKESFLLLLGLSLMAAAILLVAEPLLRQWRVSSGDGSAGQKWFCAGDRDGRWFSFRNGRHRRRYFSCAHIVAH